MSKNYILILLLLCIAVVQAKNLSFNPDDMRYFLYESPTRVSELIFGNNLTSGEINTKKPLVVVIDGFTSPHHKTEMANKIRDGVLSQNYPKEEKIVLVIDWSALSGFVLPDGTNDYLNVSEHNVPTVGNRTAEFLYFLYGNQPQLPSIHVIGHSLGAHIAGATGKRFQELFSRKIDRITGLDPAGPNFMEDAERQSRQLGRNHSIFVDIWHTSRQMGVDGNVTGHLNVYVNGGDHQPNCWAAESGSELGGGDGPKYLCDHAFSWRVFVATFDKDYFGCPCEGAVECRCTNECKKICTNPIAIGYRHTPNLTSSDLRMDVNLK